MKASTLRLTTALALCAVWVVELPVKTVAQAPEEGAYQEITTVAPPSDAPSKAAGAESAALAACQEADNINQELGNAFFNLISTQGVGQSFTATCTGRLRALQVNMYTVDSSPMQGTLRIFEGAGGSGRQLAAVPYSLYSAGWAYLTLSEKDAYVILLAGQTYTFFLDAPASGAGNVLGYNGNPYPGGNAYAGSNPSNVVPYGADVTFRLDIAPITCTVDDYITGCDLLADIDALVALYTATNGPSWTNQTDWFTQNIGNWHGITVTAGRVTGISLVQNNLTGSLPTEIGNLSELTSFSVLQNQLVGSIPSSMGSLSKLTEAEFSGNLFTGTLPSTLGNLKALWFLSVYGNSIGGSIPSSLGGMTAMVHLQLGKNAFTGSVPAELGNMPNLELLYLGDNPGLNGALPGQLGNIPKLKQLEFYNTGISGELPANLTSLSSLNRLWFGNTDVCVPNDTPFQNWLATVADVQGNGILCVPVIQLSANSLPFGSVQVGQSKDLTLTVHNAGRAAADLDVSAGTGFASSGFSFVSGAGTGSLPVGADRNVVVRFTPGSAGIKLSDVKVDWTGTNVGGGSTIPVTGTAVSPSIAVSPSPLAFGDVRVGSTKDLIVTITNNGTADLTGSVSEGANFAASGYTIQNGGGAYTLTPGQNKQVTVRLAPTSTGSKSSSLQITHDATNTANPVSVPLTGNGTVAQIAVDPASLAYGNVQVGSSKDLTVTIANTGTAVLSGSVAGGADFTVNGYAIQDGGGAFALTPGQSKQVTVRLAPSSEGTKSSSLQITHDGANASSPVTVALTGNGTAAPAPAILVSLASLSFGDVVVGTTKDLGLTITNTGDVELTGSVAGGTDFASNGFEFQSGEGAFTLGAGLSTEVVVRFGPASVGSKASSLQISHDGSNTSSPVAVTLTGQAIEGPATVAVSPTTLDFGTVAVGSSVERTFTVSHSGSEGRLVGSVSDFGDLEDKGFAFVAGGGNFDLGPGETLDVTLSFTPAASGDATAEIKVNHNATNAEANILVALAASAVDPVDPTLEVTQASLNFGDVEVGSIGELTLTLRNVGNGTLSGEVGEPSGTAAERYTLQSGAGPFALGADETLQVVVRFAPEVEGAASGIFQITHDGSGPASPVSVPLSGNGVIAAAAPVATTDEVTIPVICAEGGTCVPPGPVLIPVLENDSDPNGDTVQLVGVVALPLKGLTTVNGDGTITYQAFASSAEGTDSFQYQITDGSLTATGTVTISFVTTTSTDDDRVPGTFFLAQNYPNPFNPSTVLRYGLGTTGRVRLQVFTPTGRLVETLVDRVQQAGSHEVTFEAGALPSGAYVYVLEQDGRTKSGLMTLFK